MEAATAVDGLLDDIGALRRYVTELHERRDHRGIVASVARWRANTPYPYDSIDTWSLLAMGTAAAVATNDASNALAWSRALDGIRHRAKKTSPPPYNKYVHELRAKGEVRKAIAAMAASPRTPATPMKVRSAGSLERYAEAALGSSMITVLAFDAKRRIGWVIDHERSGDRVWRFDGKALVPTNAAYLDFQRFACPAAPTWTTKPPDQRVVFGSRACDIATVERHGTDVYVFARTTGGGHSQKTNFWFLAQTPAAAQEVFDLLVAQRPSKTQIHAFKDPRRGYVVRTYVRGWGSGRAQRTSIAAVGARVFISPRPRGTNPVVLSDETGATEHFGYVETSHRAALARFKKFEANELKAGALQWLSFMTLQPTAKSSSFG